MGVRDTENFKAKDLLINPNTNLLTIGEAVKKSEVILLSTLATLTIDVIKSLGDSTGKIIIDAMIIVTGRGPIGYKNTTEAILQNTQTKDVVKCLYTTGFNNIQNPIYGDVGLDMFVAGGSEQDDLCP